MFGDNTDSLETTSSSVVEDSLNISFENVNYVHGILPKSKKTILQNLYGTFNAGELSVIVGQSGAGKSTLMDILAGYTKPTSGRLLVNGQIRKENSFRRRSCYILQDDKIQEMLTIQESLEIAAELKLGNHISQQQKKKRVNEIITSLGLNESANTRSIHLSGGQKKRLAIGLELVSDPPVMFLDEPTSGLDFSTSKQVVYLLYLLARQGRTVVITMHQPSAPLLQMVDRLYTVSAGRCAYMGSVPLLLTFLEENNFTCPPYHNPVDILIEVCMENTDKLVRCSDNGRNLDWTSNISLESVRNVIGFSNLRCDDDDVYLTTLPTPKENSTRKTLLAIKSSYSTSIWKQFITLTRRSLLVLYRNSTFTLMITGIHIAMASMMGILFFNIGSTAENIMNNYRFLYFSLMFLMFTSFSAMSLKFPEEMAVVRREHFNRWYTTSAYYFSTLLSMLPTQTVCTLTYAFIVYLATGQPLEIERFSLFCITLLGVSYVALCIGLLNGSIFDVKNSAIFGPFFIMPFTIFSGFFLSYGDAPVFFRWMFHISFLKHGLVGLVIAIFGLNRPKLKCEADYCHFKNTQQFIVSIQMNDDRYWFVLVALLAISFVVITTTYIILRIRLKSKW